MSKCEKYWLFGMVLMLSITHQETQTMLGAIANVITYIAATIYFVLMVREFFWGAK